MGFDSKVTACVEWALKWKWSVLIVTLILVIAAGSGTRHLTFNNDYHIYFDDDNPQVLAFDALQNKYTKDDNVFIVIQPEGGKVFSRETLAAVAALEEMAWQLPFSTRVDALSNYQYTHSVGDDMYVENLYDDLSDKTDAEIDHIGEIAMGQKLLRNRMLNDSVTVTAVNVTFNLPADTASGAKKTADHVRKMIADWAQKYPGYHTYMSGTIMFNATLSETAVSDMALFVPVMFLVILVTVLITTGSASGMVAAFLILLFSVATAMGLTGWAGIELSGPTSAAPTMIMTLAIADSIHILVSMLLALRRGLDKISAIKESMRINFMPVLLTSVTTVIGFLSLNFAEGAPFQDLGNITAAGVGVALLLSLTTLPALLAFLPMRVKAAGTVQEHNHRILGNLAEFVITHNRTLLVIMSALMLLVGSLALTNELNNEFVKFFDKPIKFRSDTDFISKNLSGIYNVEYSLSAGEPDGICNPDYLHNLDEFEAWLLEQPEVTHVRTFSEIMKQLNKSMHGDSLEFYRIPGTREECAQFLLLYEMSLPYGLDLNNQINVDKSETRYVVTTRNISSNQMIALTARAEDWLRDNCPKYMFTFGISPSVMFAHITRRNMVSMLKGGFGALALISFLLIFALKSFKYGLISLIPNVMPIIVAFGIWALIEGQINMALAMVLGMTLGIVVDDTIHLLTKYMRGRRELGKSPEDAVRYAFATVGKAVVVTTVVLVCGFSVLLFSTFALNSSVGKLTAITIAVALLLDLLMLPALLLAFDKDHDADRKEHKEQHLISSTNNHDEPNSA